MAINLVPTEVNLTRIVAAIRELIQGRSNATLTVTLGAGAATTVVVARNCGKDSIVVMTPKTANAAAAIATTFVLASNVRNGGFTISHANNAQTDRTFGVECRG